MNQYLQDMLVADRQPLAGTLQRSALPTGKGPLHGGLTIVAASSTAIGS
jgi:hypothetical protein